MKKFGFFILIFLTMLTSLLPFDIFSPTQVKIVQANNWQGWDLLTTIYYNPAQDDGVNQFLNQAATEIQTFLARTNVNLDIVTGSIPESGAIYLSVNPSYVQIAGLGDEAFHIISDTSNISIVGNTPIAVRHGAYRFLEELGFRWYFKSDIWTIIPDSLVSFEGLNIVEKPDFIYRGFQPSGIYNGLEDLNLWYDRNRAFGAASYQTSHTYNGIYPYSNRATDPESFVGTGDDLNPYSENVINAAIEYAISRLGNTFNYSEYHDYLPYGSISISPNDGSKWDPPWTNVNDSIEITNAVYSLANEVAKQIYPTLVGVYSYSYYATVPTIELEPNILAVIALDTAMCHTTQSFVERVRGLIEKGVQVGIREYLDIWQWYYDTPRSLSKCEEVPIWYNLGARYYQAELTDNWGGAGLRYYIMSKVLWNTMVDIDALYDEFFEKSFGAAAETMKRYWEVRSASEANIAEAFRLLNQAQIEAIDDEGSLSRIRFMQCYTYSLWKRKIIQLSNLSDEEADDYYNFVTKTRDLYIDSYNIIGDAALQESLSRKDVSATITGSWSFTRDSVFVQSTNGNALEEVTIGDYIRPSIGKSWYKVRGFYSDNTIILTNSYEETTKIDTINATQILYKEVMENIIDYSPPTAEDVAGWLSEALAALSDVPYKYSVGIPDKTSPLNDSITEPCTPLRGERNKLFFTANANEDVVIKIKGTVGSNVMLSIFYNTGIMLDSYFFEGLGTDNWDMYTFTPPIIGRYYVTWNYNYDPIWIDLENHRGAAYESSESTPTLFSLSYSGYFYVPRGAESFTIGLQPPAVTGNTLTATLTNPNNQTQVIVSTYSSSSPYIFDIQSPVTGLWKIDLALSTTFATREGQFWFEGIPPLVWHDPEFLLVSEQANLLADLNGDGKVNILDLIKILQCWGESGIGGWISEDVNGDGTINILDITIAGQNWTG